jgi:hypothetical protein
MDIKMIIEEVKAIRDDPVAFSDLAKAHSYCPGSFFATLGGLMQEEKYVDTFNLMYASITNKTGFRRIRREDILNRVKTFNSGKLEEIDAIKNAVDAMGDITIYRGQNDYSSHYRRALSWTLKRDSAIWFSRWYTPPGNSVVYKAKAKINDLITFIDDCGEDEVLIEYSNLQRIQGNKRVLREIVADGEYERVKKARDEEFRKEIAEISTKLKSEAE